MSDNELISEFMGAKNVSKTKGVLYSFIDNIDFCEAIAVQTKDGEYLFYLKDLIFDKSWDWLMPVVEKIGQMEGDYTVSINTQKEPSLYGHECSIYDSGHAVSFLEESKKLIEAVYKAVTEFIKWHNQQTK